MKNSAIYYVIKQLLAFGLIYGLSAVLGEGVIIGLLYGMGYAPLHGVIPSGLLGELLPYYGFSIFLLVTIFYCRFVEKRTLGAMGFTTNWMEYLWGVLGACVLLLIIIGACCIGGGLQFQGYNRNEISWSLVFWLIAFMIQGAAEEVICRGFLLQTLLKRIPVPIAIIISSTAFAFPHFTSLLEAEWEYVIIGIVNLYFVSAIFSVLVLLRSNIWSACGLHSIWNFVLYGIMGLSVSGSQSSSDSVLRFYVKDGNVLNGGEYGIEAGIVTTLVLGLLLFVLVKRWKGRMERNEI